LARQQRQHVDIQLIDINDFPDPTVRINANMARVDNKKPNDDWVIAAEPLEGIFLE